VAQDRDCAEGENESHCEQLDDHGSPPIDVLTVGRPCLGAGSSVTELPSGVFIVIDWSSAAIRL
jgi:hypothetical protein